jgi:hypothetical protein
LLVCVRSSATAGGRVEREEQRGVFDESSSLLNVSVP